METVNSTDNSAYAALLAKVPPRVIRTDEENEYFIQVLGELDQRSENLTPEEKDLADLLTLLIEEYEDRAYKLPQTSPRDVLVFLMEQHGLKQRDLVDVFGTPSIVSEIINGKRELNKEQIRRLSERFHVSPEVFF